MIETIETFVTLLFAGLALLAGAGFILFRQPVYAAVSFTATVLSASVLYIMLNAAYVAAATMVIYAGATIIIFLFVLMFAQHSNLQLYELKYSNLPPALIASLTLIVLLGYAVSTRDNADAGITNLPMPPQALTTTPDGINQQGNATKTDEPSRLPDSEMSGSDMSVAALGREMYTRYLWTIELAGTLLLVAACGAIVIAQRENSSQTGAQA